MKIPSRIILTLSMLWLISSCDSGKPEANKAAANAESSTLSADDNTTTATQDSPNVMINKLPVARAGDNILAPGTVYPVTCESGTVTRVSSSVFVNGKAAAIVDSKTSANCNASTAAGGLPNVVIGN